MTAAAGPGRGRSPGADIESGRFVRNNALTTASTLFAGVLGFAVQAVTGHNLHPGQFGKAAAVLTFFAILTRGSASFGRLVAWQTSRDLSEPDTLASGALRQVTLWLFALGIAAAAVSIAAGTILASYLDVPFHFIVVGAIGVPFMLTVQPLLGSVQGEQRFVPWSFLTIFIAVARLVATGILVFVLGAYGVVWGSTLSLIASFIVGLFMVRRRIVIRGSFAWRRSIPFIVTGLASTLAVGVFAGGDVVVVQHYYARTLSGQYAIVSVLGNGLFFATGGVTAALFPIVAARQKLNRSTFGVMRISLGLCALTTVVGTAFLQLFGRRVLTIFAGHSYAGGAHYLGWYALGMGLLGCAVVLVNTVQSLNGLALLWVLVPAIILRPVALIAFHGTLLTVAVVSDISIAIFTAIVGAMYVGSELARRRDHPDDFGQDRRAPQGGEGLSGALAGEPELAELVGSVPVVADISGAPGPLITVPSAGSLISMPSAEPARAGPVGVLSRWTGSPPRVIAAIAVLALVVRHGWIGTKPLAAGDWHWPARSRVLAWFPWPSVWDSSLGFSGQNRFSDVFRFPVFAVTGLLAAAGADWTLIERVVYFLPYAVLLPVAGWLLAREILGPTRWTILAPLLLLGNTYFLIEANGEVPLPLAEAIAILVLVAFLRCMRRRSLKWAVITGLLTAATAAFDIRPAYLSVLMMAGLVVVLAISEPGWRLLGRRLFLGGVAGTVFLGTQAFWILPLVTYHGHAALPTPKAPNFSIITLSHGIAGVAAGWTGGTPAALVEAPLNPMFMVIPLIALVPLTWRRIRPEVLWLTALAVIFAFLAKTVTPPFGGFYEFLYLHVPGFNLFREGSKFYFPIGMAYAVLVPAALQSFAQRRAGRSSRRDRMVRAGTAVALLVVLAIVGSTVSVLERSSLGSTTVPSAEPASFSSFNRMINADHHEGSILWFGQPVYATGAQGAQKEHRYLISSTTHAETNLTGKALSSMVNRRDLLQYYCPVVTQAFCYVRPGLFPYLAHMVGASYVVAPGGSSVGHLPRGITRSWLSNQLRSMLGPPAVLGSGSTSLLVWHLATTGASITSVPAVALVDSGPWSLPTILPALQAMGVPAAYRQTFDHDDFPAARPGLPDSVGVEPYEQRSCRLQSPQTTALMARSTAGSLQVTVDGRPSTLRLLGRSVQDPAWADYGPLSLPAGTTAIGAVGTSVAACVQWGTLTGHLLSSGPARPTGALRVAKHGERLSAPLRATATGWVELRRMYDPGWRLSRHKPVAVADSLFNLYHLDRPLGAGQRLTFTFSTLKWERIGQAAALFVLALAVILAVVASRRERRRGLRVAEVAPMQSRTGSFVGGVGLVFLGLTALAVGAEWVGLASRFPWSAPIGDPYSLDVVTGTAALGLLGLSVAVRLMGGVLRRIPVLQRATDGSPAPGRLRRRARTAGAIAMVTAVLLSGCAVGGSGQALHAAQQAQKQANVVAGASLSQAKLAAAARAHRRCVTKYTKALKVYPDLVSAYAGRASCYRSYDSAAAVHDLDRALTLSPGNPALLLQRAGAYRGIGAIQKAARNYEATVAAPDSTSVENAVAIDGLVSIGEPEAATTALREALGRLPRSSAVWLAAFSLARSQGDGGAMTAALNEALATGTKAGQQAAVDTHLCQQQLLEHKFSAALTSCRRSAVLSRNGYGAYDDLSAADLDTGNLSAAIADMQAAIGAFIGSTGPNRQPAGVDGYSLSGLYEEEGRLLVEAQQSSQAVAAYRLALKALPGTSPDAKARLKADIVTAERGLG